MMGRLPLVFTLILAIAPDLNAQATSTIPSTPTEQSSPMIKRDPTKPFTGNAEVTGQLELRSILIGTGRRIALINDTFVQVGDTIGPAKVIAIQRDSVILIDSGKTETLYLFTNDIRK